MSDLLVIKSSILGAYGSSNKLVDQFKSNWESKQGGDVVLRDLTAEGMPHLDGATLMAMGTPADKRTEEQSAQAALADTLLAEFKAAKNIVIGLPMYNLGMPSMLKAWFDHVMRAGETFRYTAEGPVGLAGDKTVYLMVARGGVYEGDADTQLPQVIALLKFMGITDIREVVASGLAISPEIKEKAMAKAASAVDALFA